MTPIKLSDELNQYIINYQRLTNRSAISLPLTELEMRQMRMLITEYMSKNPSDESVYYIEDAGDAESTILVWRGAEIYENPEALNLRNSIKSKKSKK